MTATAARRTTAEKIVALSRALKPNIKLVHQFYGSEEKQWTDAAEIPQRPSELRSAIAQASRTFWTPAFTEVFTFSPVPVSRSNTGAFLEWLTIVALVFFTFSAPFEAGMRGP